jgi:hypothetical protein
MTGADKQVFISYVREDVSAVEYVCGLLTATGIPYWRDRTSLGPGMEWKRVIREAISADVLVFLACFSRQSQARRTSYMNEELTLAVDQFRLRPPGATWLIPVRLDDCAIPDWDLGAGRRLSDIQHVDLFGPGFPTQAAALVGMLARLTRAANSTTPAFPTDAAPTIVPAAPEAGRAVRVSQKAGRGAVQAGRDITAPVATGPGATATASSHDPDRENGDSPG